MREPAPRRRAPPPTGSTNPLPVLPSRALRPAGGGAALAVALTLALSIALHGTIAGLTGWSSFERPLPEPETVELDIVVERRQVAARAVEAARAQAQAAAEAAPVAPPAPAATAAAPAASVPDAALAAAATEAVLLAAAAQAAHANVPGAIQAPTTTATAVAGIEQPAPAAGPATAASTGAPVPAPQGDIANASAPAAPSIAAQPGTTVVEPGAATDVPGATPAGRAATALVAEPRRGTDAPGIIAADAPATAAGPLADAPRRAGGVEAPTAGPHALTTGTPVATVGIAGRPNTTPAAVAARAGSSARPGTAAPAGAARAPIAMAARPVAAASGPIAGAVTAAPVREAALRVIDPDTVRERLRTAAAGLRCGRVEVAVSPELAARVTGRIGNRVDLGAVHSELAAAGAASLDLALEKVPEPLCPVLQIVEAGAAQSAAPVIGLNREAGVYIEGDVAVFTIDVPDTIERGQLYVAFVDPAGEVVHLLPSAERRDAFVRGGARVRLGVERAEHRAGMTIYEVTPPFGPGLIVALITAVALPGAVYSEVRPLAEYLQALAIPLDVARAQGPVLVATRLIETRPR